MVAVTGDDANSAAISLPVGFGFQYFGAPKTSVVVNSNGWMTFNGGTTVASTMRANTALPTQALANELIAPYWDDLNVTGAGTVKHQATTIGPDEVFIVQWTSVTQFNGGAPGNTFQIILYKGTNCIEFRYGTIIAQGAATGTTTASFNAGLENISGQFGFNIDPASLGTGGSAVARRYCPLGNANCLPPANDLCSAAQNLTLGASAIPGTTVLAGTDGSSSCDAAGRDVWYSVNLTSSGNTLNIDTCGSAIDTTIALYSGTCGSLTELTCNDDCGGAPCGGPSSCFSIGGLSSGVHLIRVSDKGIGSGGAFQIKATYIPSNDNCANAIAMPAFVGGLTSINGNNTGASTESSPTYCATSNVDVWYSFTSGAAGSYIVDTCSTTLDTVVSVHTACPVGTNANQVVGACSDQGCPTGNGSKVTVILAASTPYLVRVAGFSTPGAQGPFTLFISAPGAAPTNDNCGSAQTLTLGAAAVPGATAFATTDGASTCDATGRDVWYTVNTTVAGNTLYVDTCGSAIDTAVAVYSGACGSLTEIACNDDCGGSPCTGPSSCLSIPSLAIGTYKIRVSDKGIGSGGSFQVKASSLVPPPANDLCAGAITIACPSQTAGSTAGATLDAGLPDCTPVSPSPANHAGGGIAISAPGVWYRIVGTGGTVVADTHTISSSFDSKLHVFTGTCGSMTCVTANDDISAGFRSEVAFQTVLNQDYYILVNAFGTSTGTFTLNVYCDATPDNDLCGSAQVVGPNNGSAGGTTIGATGAGFTPNSNVLATCATNANDPLFDVWYSYTAPCNGTLTLGTCGAYDSLLSVHTACPTLTLGNQIAAACNDNGPGLCAPGSQLALSVTSGTTYLIRVAGAKGIEFGGNFTLSWALPDADGDGTPDACDGCPNDPLKVSPGQCGCGVVDFDTDGDGTADCIDGCPKDPAKTDPGICGCGNPETDQDGDGTLDCVDDCPFDPKKTDPGQCGCGFPDTDGDGDGTADCADGCPKDPDKTDPGICGCGVPDTDTDSDGTPDCNDGCPKDPTKTAPGDCGCGTPDTDTDGDGTPDCLDGCPFDPDKIGPGICGCGVRDVDTDGDGIPDCNDKCPGIPNDQDTDGDGTPDCLDGCPDDPDKIDPGQCGCGFADTDTDGDGTADCIDGCPDDPDKTKPGDCGCGFPDDDSDGDGTADCLDGCPDDPDKTDPGICGCGIADDDSDGDGTADCNDGCPDDPDKTDPGVCGCGFPDDDADLDGVADCDDNCVDVANPDQLDCNNNFIGDICEDFTDCNKNGIPDECDIAAETSADVNSNGIPDECEGCIGDIYAGGNGTVDVDDLLELINDWGNCLGDCPPYCISDLDNNCVVDVDDLMILINNWGDCDK